MPGSARPSRPFWRRPSSGATFRGHSKRGLSKSTNNYSMCSRIVELLISPLLLCPLISAPNLGERRERRTLPEVARRIYYHY